MGNCAGLEAYGTDALLRSVAVTPSARGGGLGRALVVHSRTRRGRAGCTAALSAHDKRSRILQSHRVSTMRPQYGTSTRTGQFSVQQAVSGICCLDVQRTHRRALNLECRPAFPQDRTLPTAWGRRPSSDLRRACPTVRSSVKSRQPSSVDDKQVRSVHSESGADLRRST